MDTGNEQEDTLFIMDSLRHKFTQCFFLAPQDKGYFVLNDAFRYVDDGSQSFVNDVGVPLTPDPEPTLVEEDHSYASIVKVMKESPAAFSVPTYAPQRSVAKSQEQPVIAGPPPPLVSETPVSSTNANENSSSKDNEEWLGQD
ncbi:hypothetical protein CMV_011911 [Castanea mollissima]|uniref:NTF2 domain-containing protein n=1 Tax=Castanea mollissima TaxID=60419 RepID=A0A8J4RAB8_9ROSI|nr:hypothetical protein CMV_011911 [Castanea mollissima]